MAFWGDNYWSSTYWSEDYWPADAAPPSYVQYPSVVFSITPAATQSDVVSWTATGDVLLTMSFSAGQSYLASDYEQVGSVTITFSPSGTQQSAQLEYSQTSTAEILFGFSALQYVGLQQLGNAVFTVSFSATQTAGTSSLQHEQLCDVELTLDPTTLQVWLLPFSGLSAQATAATVAGFPKTDTTVVLSPAQNVATENFFEFLVYSEDIGWLNNSGLLNLPLYIEVSFNGSPTVSVNVYKSRFVVGPSMSIHSTVKDGLTNKNLSVTLKGYEVYSGELVLENELTRPTTILVRGYEERRVV